MKTCSLCGYRFSGFGHNPEPVKAYRERCCDLCNMTVVIPARMATRRQFRNWTEIDTSTDETSKPAKGDK